MDHSRVVHHTTTRPCSHQGPVCQRKSCNSGTICMDCKEKKLDCDRIAKYENIHFLLFWLCIYLDGSNYVWTQIVPLIVALSCSSLVLQPWTQSACQPHWLCENHLDCVWLWNPSQSWLWWIGPGFDGLQKDCDGLQAHYRLSNPKNRIAIHSIRSQWKSWHYVKAGGLRGFWGQDFTNFLKFFSTFLTP